MILETGHHGINEQAENSALLSYPGVLYVHISTWLKPVGSYGSQVNGTIVQNIAIRCYLIFAFMPVEVRLCDEIDRFCTSAINSVNTIPQQSMPNKHNASIMRWLGGPDCRFCFFYWSIK